MRKIVFVSVSVVVLFWAVVVWGVAADSSGAARLVAAVTGQAADKPKEDVKDEPQTYLTVGRDEVNKDPAQYAGRYVQLADCFGEPVRKPSKRLEHYGITRDSHVVFTTHHGVGSNMLCAVSLDNEAAVNVLKTLKEEAPIFLQGQLGPQVRDPESKRRKMPLFLVDRLGRGHEPPPPPKKPEKKKPVLLIIEYPVFGEDGKMIRRRHGQWKIHKPGTRYVIPDPYFPNDRKKVIFVTLKF